MEEARSPETIRFSELSALEQVLRVFGGLLALGLFGVFFYFIWWKMIRAHIRTLQELAGIRAALERIADAMEKTR